MKEKNIHTVLHQHSKGGASIRGISYQLTDDAGKPITPRIKASEIGAWATWKGLDDHLQSAAQPGQPEKKPHTLDNDQYKGLAAVLSEELRGYKKEQYVYYESAVIENFPAPILQARLRAATQDKLTTQAIEEAVGRFETYKREQLPAIIQREQVAFIRSAEAYGQIAGAMQAGTVSKQAFFKAMGLDLAVDGQVLNPDNRHLSYQLPVDQLGLIRQNTGPEVPIPSRYQRGERAVVLLSAAGKPFGESWVVANIPGKCFIKHSQYLNNQIFV